jgi:hypothetical protein
VTANEQIKRGWERLLDMKGDRFNHLGVFRWTDRIKWRTRFQEHEYPRFEIFKGGLTGLKYLLWYLVDMYCYAVAAETLAREHEAQDEKPIAGFWRYRIRNYHIYDFIPRYFSFLDHAAYFAASLSEWKLVQKSPLERKGTMYYGTFLPLLCKSIQKEETIGYLTFKDRKILYELLRRIDMEPEDPDLNRIARRYRQESSHLFFPGIDHIVQTIAPQFEKQGKHMTFNPVAFGLRGEPAYRFEALEEFGSKAIPMIDSSLEMLFATDLMSSLLEKAEE